MLARSDEGTYQVAWIDTFHTAGGILWSTGDGADPVVLASYGPPEAPWGWRTQFTIDGDRLVITAWNITPGGEEGKATEAIYTRV